jgi:diaminopimelate epimerase
MSGGTLQNMKKRIEFTKMQGIGNDYIYVSTLNQQLDDPSGVARRISDRHFGIGSDGLVLIRPSAVADFMMDMYNSDGSQAKMCGNAIRCVAKYVYDRGLTRKKRLQIETLSGIKTLDIQVSDGVAASVTVNMGQPVFESARIPIRWHDERLVEEPIAVAGRLYKLTCVSMGNPHAVTFIEEVDSLDLNRLGPAFEHHTLFPDRVNTEFVQVLDRQNLRMRVWERGSGETLACGTGACAAVAAAVLTGRCERQVTVHLNGGDLSICWNEASNDMLMTGPAVFVFDGWIEIGE